MKKTQPKKVNDLRQRAEKLLKGSSALSHQNPGNPAAAQLSESETIKLIHELEVQRVELELQKEELVQAESIANQALDNYIELYDFAPSGYVTLSPKGEIRKLNLTCSILLGKERSLLINRRLDSYITEGTQPEFTRFLESVFSGLRTETCEVALTTGIDSPLFVHLDGKGRCLDTDHASTGV